MIQDIETQLQMEKKRYLTPKHVMYQLSEDDKLKYAAAVFTLMVRDSLESLSNDFEMQRFLEKGLLLSKKKMVAIFSSHLNPEKYLVWLGSMLKEPWKKYVFVMDYLNILLSQYEQKELSEENLKMGEQRIKKIAIYFQISESALIKIREFIVLCRQEEKLKALSKYEFISRFVDDLPEAVLKYYGINNSADFLCTQKLLERQKELVITDRCVIQEDLVIREGMKVSFQYSEVRIYGNISLEGGELVIDHSCIIRKSDSHRACINIKTSGKLQIIKSEGDGRNLGMFIRAAAGEVMISDSFIHNTTCGAAVRFWGQKLEIRNTRFENCYAYENGGAIMARGGSGSIINCFFSNCEAKRGGAMYMTDQYIIKQCRFRKCSVEEYGACLYYQGMIDEKVSELQYASCCPEGAEIVQYLSSWGDYNVDGKLHLQYGTIVDAPITVRSTGILFVDGATLYMNYPMQCMGTLIMYRSKIVCGFYEEGKDLIQLQHARKVRISHCIFDGKSYCGMIHAGMTRIQINDSVFCNTKGGRAIYNAYMSVIKNTLFNFCEDGAIQCQGGMIANCTFVNCRSKSGAGVQILGTSGTIQNCHFRRCVSKLSGGAIDRTRGQKVIQCSYEDCAPNNCT